MSLLSLAVNAMPVVRGIQRLRRRVAFVAVNSINETLKDIQEEERKNVSRHFVVRKPDFTLRQAAIIKPFASVRRHPWEGRVSVGIKNRFLLAKFEQGGERGAFKGKGAAVPVIGGPARPTFRQQVPETFAFKRLGLRKAGASSKGRVRRDTVMQRTVSKKGTVQWKGQHRTFILTETAKAPDGGVFQRVGPGDDDIRLVYSFKRHQKLDRRLRFLPTAERVARFRGPRRFQEQVRKSITHSLRRGL